jgi:hypothetical protein
VEHRRVDPDHQRHPVVAAGDVLGRLAQVGRPAELLEANEVGVLRAQGEEQVRPRRKAVIGAVVITVGRSGAAERIALK